ncbi:TatD family hydrolase [Candidatus Phytoplasma solani]|uniref:Mg-dependent DNase n=1 Tax=Candidatus Phytoplasma solani TaxID=69896 RepID=A0A421NYV9_9MOLU|nr:TatD family hydrolase [Candidatus Phytoplasma solani]RMI89188.1 Mg-dependent DNase [Candidatus Phytoplasma solani]RMI89206.1 Mg-dependent DNase [Candidatus Phytoplasma solani]CCP87990.1 Mg-dependent DNase [Candidatus Phytoplasma solani]CCP88506.1 Mg-dependent DNase [Candidatus Phytoplasma solani]
MLIDTHAHLNLKTYEKDFDEVLKRAFQNDIKKMIVVGMDEKSNQKTFEIANKYPDMMVSFGIHPCSDFSQETPESIVKYLNHPQTVAVGEIGLDLHHRQDNLEIQKKFFQVQIEIAIKFRLPVIIHARKSFEEIYQLLLPYKGQIRGVFHCLVFSEREVKMALELGFYVGIGGVVTFENAKVTHQIAKNTPLDRILLETDAPFLTPFPFQKERNEPAHIKLIADKIAQLRNISLQKVATQTSNNVNELFLKRKNLQ